jgi:hypothetical protein
MKKYCYAVKGFCPGNKGFVGECVAENLQQVIDLFGKDCRLTFVEQRYEVEQAEQICVRELTELK